MIVPSTGILPCDMLKPGIIIQYDGCVEPHERTADSVEQNEFAPGLPDGTPTQVLWFPAS